MCFYAVLLQEIFKYRNFMIFDRDFKMMKQSYVVSIFLPRTSSKRKQEHNQTVLTIRGVRHTTIYFHFDWLIQKINDFTGYRYYYIHLFS